MKQHIIEEQWDELTGKQKEAFGELDTEIAQNHGIYVVHPSIGRMIEFLGDDFVWVVINPDGMGIIKSDELCDALWSAVKEKLRG